MATLQTDYSYCTNRRYSRNASVSSDHYYENAIDGNENTYYGQYDTSTHDWFCVDGMKFPQINSSVKIVGCEFKAKVAAYKNRSGTDGIKATLVTDYNTVTHPKADPEAHTAISTEMTLLASGDTNDTLRWVTIQNTDETSSAIQWMNANKTNVATGDQFGVWIYCRYCKIAIVEMKIFYEPLSSDLYNGSKQASAIYVGNKQGEMYIGTTKVL